MEPLSRTARFWQWWAALSLRRPWPIVLLASLAFFAALPAAVRLYGDLRTDLRELLPQGAPAAVALQELEKRIGGFSHLNIVVRTENLKAGERFVDALGARLKELPPSLVAQVHWRADAEKEFLDRHGALYADVKDLIFPGILAGFLLAFALSMDDFVISNFVQGPATMFPTWVFGATKVGIPPHVFVFATLIFLGGVTIVATMTLGQSVSNRRRKAAAAAIDYDGDGNLTEGMYYEVDGLRAKLYQAIQAYALVWIENRIKEHLHTLPDGNPSATQPGRQPAGHQGDDFFFKVSGNRG